MFTVFAQIQGIVPSNNLASKKLITVSNFYNKKISGLPSLCYKWYYAFRLDSAVVFMRYNKNEDHSVTDWAAFCVQNINAWGWSESIYDVYNF